MAGENVYMAKLAEQAERYDEMVEYMKMVAQSSETTDLSLEERNLLSVAYKNVVGARRASLRIIGSIMSKEQEKGGHNVAKVSGYKEKVENELNTICTDILALLDNTLLKRAGESSEATVFYMKMKAGERKKPGCAMPPLPSPTPSPARTPSDPQHSACSH